MKELEKKPRQPTTRKQTVKIGLKAICPVDRVRQRIQEDAQVMSNLMYEVSNLAYFGLNHTDSNLLMDEWSTKKPNFQHLAIALKEEKRAQRNKRHAGFTELINQYKATRAKDLHLYDCKNRTDIIKQLMLAMEVNFKTNIVKHFESRLIRLIMCQRRGNGQRDDKKGQKPCSSTTKAAPPLPGNKKEMGTKIKSERDIKKELSRYKGHKKRQEERTNQQKKPGVKKKTENYNKMFTTQFKVDDDEERKRKKWEKRQRRAQKKDKKQATAAPKVEPQNRRNRRNGISYKSAKEIVKNLMKTNECDNENFQIVLNGENLDFREFKKNWFKFLPFLKRTQQFFHDNNVRNCKLVPLTTLGTHHIYYSNTCLKELDAALKGKVETVEKGTFPKVDQLLEEKGKLEKKIEEIPQLEKLIKALKSRKQRDGKLIDEKTQKLKILKADLKNESSKLTEINNEIV